MIPHIRSSFVEDEQLSIVKLSYLVCLLRCSSKKEGCELCNPLQDYVPVRANLVRFPEVMEKSALMILR